MYQIICFEVVGLAVCIAEYEYMNYSVELQ